MTEQVSNLSKDRQKGSETYIFQMSEMLHSTIFVTCTLCTGLFLSVEMYKSVEHECIIINN